MGKDNGQRTILTFCDLKSFSCILKSSSCWTSNDVVKTAILPSDRAVMIVDARQQSNKKQSSEKVLVVS